MSRARMHCPKVHVPRNRVVHGQCACSSHVISAHVCGNIVLCDGCEQPHCYCVRTCSTCQLAHACWHSRVFTTDNKQCRHAVAPVVCLQTWARTMIHANEFAALWLPQGACVLTGHLQSEWQSSICASSDTNTLARCQVFAQKRLSLLDDAHSSLL